MSGIRNMFDSGFSWLGAPDRRYADSFRQHIAQRMTKILGRSSANPPLDPDLRRTIETSRLAQSVLSEKTLERTHDMPFISATVPASSAHEGTQAIIHSPISMPPAIDEPNPNNPFSSLQAQLGSAGKAFIAAAEIWDKSKLLFALPPLFLWMLYSSKKNMFTKINLSIPAKSQRIAYRVTLAREAISTSVAFELKSGQPIRFLPDQGSSQQETLEEISLFQSESFATGRLLGPLNAFVGNRKEHNAVFNIIIIDPAAKMTALPIFRINDREFIRFVYGGHMSSKSGSQQSSQTVLQATGGVGEEWNGFRSINLDLDKSSGPEAPGKVQTWQRCLPSEEGNFDKNEYIKIVRQLLPE